ncbi:sulfite exporter TauE/SafE family protein [Polymorphobacter arshaanensis]|uniref:Probable membrane transporter protein n=1 Tax=Glacieibacterium arshaanense TaxID=2511025 RepID=A0A4Y9EQN4_9SPHN|nr:sulfite exporter TauE/SafE family protein [Polymorphobacter arshaanensis]TFU05579.1 sulfite exporter TauE/SafE family protein [Polymorphobacter arshaanensis]
MSSEFTFYAVAVSAVIILGLAKGGFSGVGALAVPLFSLVTTPVRAAAIILPILIVQDVVGVWAFRHTFSRPVLALLLPTAAFGVLLGWGLAAYVPVAAVELIVGLISVLFGGSRLAKAWQHRATGVPHGPIPGKLYGAVCGIAAGFTSMVAHAGGPPFQLYAMRARLDRDHFIGTSAIFFAAINWVKVPAYFALGQFDRANLTVAAWLLPIAIGSTLAGVWLVRRVSGERFINIVYALMVLVGAKLIFDGLAGL